MTHRPESSWNPPSIDRILFHFDGIYASGVFCMVVSPQLLDSQSRLMSAIALMAEKLRATLHPQDQSLLESRRRRFPTACPSPETKQDTLIVRHKHERRLYTEAAKRVRKRSPLDLEPTAANIATVYNQLTTSLDFWEDAKSWFGMPWWRKPHFDFPWAPPKPLFETLNHDPQPGRPLSTVSNDPQRTVNFGEGEKSSSLKAPALARVPRCSTTTHSESSVVRALRPRAKLISV